MTTKIAADFEHGKPLRPSRDTVHLPPEVIEAHELVYRVRRAPDMEPGDLLIVEPRTSAATGELVVALMGPDAFLGRFWAKHGARELRSEYGEPIAGEFRIVGAVNVIVRPK